MSRVYASLAVILLALFVLLAGCGGGGTQQYSEAPQPTHKAVRSVKLDDYYWADTFDMPSGKELVCIEAYEYQDGGPAISCNWEAFNKEVGNG
jgi:hypothetical protein